MHNLPTVHAVAGATLRLALLTPWDLTGFVVLSELRTPSRVLAGTFAVTLAIDNRTGVKGRIDLLLDAATTSDLEVGQDKYWFDVRFQAPNGDVSYSPKVRVVFEEGITSG